MLLPTTGELLRAVHVELAAQVLPELPDGAARRQLRAALHLLRRLERSWDRQAPYLRADNADLDHTLDELLAGTGDDDRYIPLRRRLDRLRDEPPELAGDHAVSDPDLRRLMAVNHALQELLADLDAAVRADQALPPEARSSYATTLSALHRRMLARAAEAAGTDG